MTISTLAKSPIDQAVGTEVDWPHVRGIFEVARSIRDVCFVYVIGEQYSGPVKIGTAKNPISRLRSMQTGNPRRLCVERVLLGDRALERRLHEYWEPFAIRSARNEGKADTIPGTEWFRADARETLFPILTTAAEWQADFASAAFVRGAITPEHLDYIACEAHDHHGFVVTRRDASRQLAPGGGYIVRRRPQ